MLDPGVATLLGALVGGAASLFGTVLVQHSASRSSRRAHEELIAATAILIQDDFYHFQSTIARAIDRWGWWDDLWVLPLQASIDDRKAVWAALSDRAPVDASLAVSACFTYVKQHAEDLYLDQSERSISATNIVADAQGWMDYLRQRRKAAHADRAAPTDADFEMMRLTFALLEVGRGLLSQKAKRPITTFANSSVLKNLNFPGGLADLLEKKAAAKDEIPNEEPFSSTMES
jgi:hypothetical protein